AAKDLVAIADVLVHRVGQRVDPVVSAVMAAAAREDHNLLGVLYGKQAQDELIDEREDRRIGADPQRQRQHGDRGEQWRFTQTPDTDDDIAQEGVHIPCTAEAGKGYVLLANPVLALAFLQLLYIRRRELWPVDVEGQVLDFSSETEWHLILV